MENLSNYPNTKLKLERWPYVIAIIGIAVIFWVFWNQKNLIWNPGFQEEGSKKLAKYIAQLPKVEEGFPDSAKVIIEKTIALSDSLGDNKAKGIAYYWLAKIQRTENKYGEDLAQALTNLNIANTLLSHKSDPHWKAKIFCEFAIIHSYKEKQDPLAVDSIKYYLDQASTWIPRIKQNSSDSLKYVADILRSRAIIRNRLDHRDSNFHLDSIKKCIADAENSLLFYEKIKYKEGKGISLRNLGTYYSQKEEFDTALLYFNQARQVNKQMRSLIAEERTLRAIGDCYQAAYRKNRNFNYFEKAVHSYEEALVVPETPKVNTYLNLAKAYHLAAYYATLEESTKNKYKLLLDSSAINYQKALQVAETENHLLALKDILQNYAQLCPELGGNLACGKILAKANHIYFRISSASRQAQREAVTQLKNFEMSSFQEKSEEKSRLLMLGATGLIMMVIMTFIFNFDRIRTRYYRDQIHSNLKALQAQMNPHFISNSLNSIESLINLNENRKASTYLIEFSRLARMILGYSQETEISILEEMKMLKLYLSLERLRLNRKLDYVITVDEKIDPSNIFIPPMMLQPFVENSIRHGIRLKKSKGVISIKFLQESPNLILCIVEDDGVGREKARELKSKSAFPRVSYSTQIIEERIRNLKILKGGDLRIVDLKDEKGNPKGTRVEIFIRILDKELYAKN